MVLLLLLPADAVESVPVLSVVFVLLPLLQAVNASIANTKLVTAKFCSFKKLYFIFIFVLLIVILFSKYIIECETINHIVTIIQIRRTLIGIFIIPDVRHK